MNLGKRRITNAELTTHFEAMGFEDVRTYRASGNVLFRAGPSHAIATIESGLQTALNYAVPTFLRTRAELQATLGRQVFTEEQRASHGKAQILFLKEPPDATTVQAALLLATEDDLLAVHGQEVHWLPRIGIMASDLDINALMRIVGPQTTRTEGTCQGILKKMD